MMSDLLEACLALPVLDRKAIAQRLMDSVSEEQHDSSLRRARETAERYARILSHLTIYEPEDILSKEKTRGLVQARWMIIYKMVLDGFGKTYTAQACNMNSPIAYPLKQVEWWLKHKKQYPDECVLWFSFVNMVSKDEVQ